MGYAPTYSRVAVMLLATVLLVSAAFALDHAVRHARVVAVVDTAPALLAAEEYTAAHDLMEPLVGERARAGDVSYVALYHEVTTKWAAESATKAHLQHGHEGPGGTLAPEDIER